MATNTLNDLRDEYEHLLVKGLGECQGKLADSKGIINTFKEHIRNDEFRREVQKVVLVDKLSPKAWFSRKWLLYAIPLLASLSFSPMLFPSVSNYVTETIQGTECLMESNFFLGEMGRPVFDCNICRDLTTFPVVNDLSREEFTERFAYYSTPVLVKQATVNWTAVGTFTFKYFQALYRKAQAKMNNSTSTASDEEMEMEREGPECQFFPYRTNFDNLMDAMEMSDERSEYREGEDPWYIGWSNCDEDTQTELRRHYQRPYFLPADSETVAIDWIFMGGTGRGAPMHLDTVGRPSWQAQISGKKTWTLQPPPECEAVCHTIDATMEEGDIIVVDTNQWYHTTFVHPGALSITIGSEYD